MDEDDIDIRGLFGVLRRQFRVIVISVLIVMSAAFLYVYTRAPLYTASTLIMVDPVGKNILDSGQGAQNSNLNNVRVDGELEILRSDAVAVRVVESANLMKDPEFGLSEAEARSDLDPSILLKTVIQNFQRALTIERKGQTYLIAVSVTSEDAVRAAELTNIVAGSYIAQQIATKVESIHKVAAILRTRLEEARVALESSDADFNAFIMNNIASIEAATGRSDLADLQAALAAVKDRSAQTEQRLLAVETELQNKNWQTLAEDLQNDTIAQLDRQRLQAESLLAAAANGSQGSIDLRRELASIDDALTREAAAATTALQAEASDARTQVNETQANIRQTVLGGDLPPDMLTKIYELQQSSSITRSQYDSFLTRLRDVELQADLQVADARIVSPALPPLAPSSQSKATILIIAGVLAAGLGVALTFLNEYFIGGFTNVKQLSNAFGQPVAARIPAVTPIKPSENPKAEPSAAEVYLAQPLSAYAEAIRRLRVSLDQALGRQGEASMVGPEGGKVIMVTSTVPEEGKSNTALALGRTYAASGLRTVLIDCDLRKPRLHRFMGVEPDIGMLDYLTGAQDVEGIEPPFQQDPASALKVLLGAGRSNVPTDQLLVSQRFAQLIKAARSSFDIVILDTPPLLPVVDGLYLAHYADVITVMVKWASTRQQDLRSVLPALREATHENVTVLPVLSQERSRKLAYYPKYGSYYGKPEKD